MEPGSPDVPKNPLLPCPTGSNKSMKCSNGCGFFGDPMLNQMCSKCHKELYHNYVDLPVMKDSLTILQPIESKKEETTCFECHRKVGLTIIRCRCGFSFCGKHRYPETHKCTYDFKTSERDKLQKFNPKISGNKGLIRDF